MLKYPARPKDLLVYYGYLNSFNSAIHSWVNEPVAQELAKYDILVFGDGVQDPSHPDYANTQIIIPRIIELNPEVIIFGYVTVNQDISLFQTKVAQWNTLEVQGIFLDEAGYDFGKTRVELNTRVDYVHNQTTSKIAFANAWNIDHVLGIVNDGSYPNSTFNPGEVQSNLNSGDWYMLESYVTNTTAYSGNGGYTSVSDWSARGAKAASYRNIYNINMASLNVIANSDGNAQTLFNNTFYMSLQYAMDAVGSSDTNYGASSAQVNFWVRPKKALGTSKKIPSVTQDVGNANKWIRYGKNSRLITDWTTASAPTYVIEKW